MFKDETLFILGAGASYPYGFPLGSELVSYIIEDIDEDKILLPYLSSLSSKYYFNGNDKNYIFDDFIASFQQVDLEKISMNIVHSPQNDFYYTIYGQPYISVKLSQIIDFRNLRQKLIDFAPVSIDAFLRDNRSLEIAGKLMIVYSLLKRENDDAFTRRFQLGTHDLSDNWYSYLINDIVNGCAEPPDLLKNQLNIITFNYDLSLEFCLFKKLSEIEFFQFENSSNKFIEQLKSSHIKHVYGQLYTYDVLQDYGKFYGSNKQKIENNFKRLIKAVMCLNNIRIIAPDRNAHQVRDECKKIIENAKEIIIIGFSFDRDNLNILGFPENIILYRDFFKGKRIKYMDYNGKMNNLSDQFENIKKYPEITITRSKATRIIDAYQNDFKIYLYQNQKIVESYSITRKEKISQFE